MDLCEPRETLLEVAALTKRYDDQPVLLEVGFAIHPGEVLGIIGPNGAGKTTLLEAVAGLLPVDAGQIRCRGELLPGGRRREEMFYLPDGVRAYADQIVERVLTFFAGVYRRPVREVSEVVAKVGLRPVLVKRVHSLSKGYNRRLLIALALLTRHPILLMDEPFDGFDLRQSRDMMLVLRGVAASGRSLILSIHQLRDAEEVCDRFALLADGRVRGVGTLDELRAHAARPAGHLEDIFLALT
jgi:ABC-type multidrug transport system ATPase subunit